MNTEGNLFRLSNLEAQRAPQCGGIDRGPPASVHPREEDNLFEAVPRESNDEIFRLGVLLLCAHTQFRAPGEHCR
jgi:hypothetical protein